MRPWTVNAERSWHYHKRAKYVKEWREAFCLLAQEQKIPPLGPCQIIATPYTQGKGRTQDLGACFPAAKAAIDGLVDAGLWPDDDPRFVVGLGFRPPVKKQGNAMELIVRTVE